MINKYFGITLLSASLAIAGCSSNDDDDGPGTVTTPVGGPVVLDLPVSTTIDVPTEFPTTDLGGADLTLDLGETLTNLNNFTFLLQAASDAGLVESLGDVTVFAPTDNAFANFMAVGGEVPVETEALADFLLGHVVDGALSGDLIDANVGSSVTALNGSTLTFTVSDNAGGDTDADSELMFVNGVLLTTTDVRASNGIIHILDDVITP